MPGPQIRNRKAITDHVAEWMHNHCPSWSIDTLLTHPDKAIAMAKCVLRRLGQKKPDSSAIHEVCRAALSSRKRGDLKRDPV